MFKRFTTALVISLMLMVFSTSAFAADTFQAWISTSMEMVLDHEEVYRNLDVTLLPTTTTMANIQDLNDGYALGSEFERETTRIIGNMNEILNEADFISATQTLTTEQVEQLNTVRARAAALADMTGTVALDVGSYIIAIDMALEAYHAIQEDAGAASDIVDRSNARVESAQFSLNDYFSTVSDCPSAVEWWANYGNNWLYNVLISWAFEEQYAYNNMDGMLHPYGWQEWMIDAILPGGSPLEAQYNNVLSLGDVLQTAQYVRYSVSYYCYGYPGMNW